MFSLLLLKPIRIYSTLLHTEFTQAAIIIAWGDPYKFYSIHIDLTTCCIWLVVVFTQRPGHRTDTRGRHRPQGEIWWQIQHLASVLSCITLQPTAFPHNSWGRNHRIRIAEVGKVPQVHPVQPLNVTAQPLLFSFTSSFSGFNYKRNSFFFFFFEEERGEDKKKRKKKPSLYETPTGVWSNGMLSRNNSLVFLFWQSSCCPRRKETIERSALLLTHLWDFHEFVSLRLIGINSSCLYINLVIKRMRSSLCSNMLAT